MRSFFYKTWRVLRWPLGAIVLLFVALFLYELVKYPQRSRDTVAAIHAQRLTMSDVDGSNLPPAPDPNLVDATVKGIDANHNGIRDDVELAIFKKYPNDIKTRSAALQYVMMEQMYLTHVFNTATWKAVAEESGRANVCLIELKLGYRQTSDLAEVIEALVYNTNDRVRALEAAHKNITSYGAADGQACDVPA